jgi:hypothetical protein
VGTAVVEVTEVPHRGCGKFSRRLGVDNLKFVNSQACRELNLRAANAPIVSDGVSRPGYPIAVMKFANPRSPAQ